MIFLILFVKQYYYQKRKEKRLKGDLVPDKRTKVKRNKTYNRSEYQCIYNTKNKNRVFIKRGEYFSYPGFKRTIITKIIVAKLSMKFIIINTLVHSQI